MNKRWGWLLVIAATLVAGFGFWRTQEPPLGDYRDPETVSRGLAVYAQHCAVCHGEGARGENPSSPMGGYKPDGTYLAPALDGTGHAWHHAPELLFSLIKEGSPALDSPMRGFAGRLADEEIAAVIAYFRSLWPEKIQSRYREAHPH